MPCPSFLLTLLFSKKEQNFWCLMSEICQTFLMVSVVMAKTDPGGRMRGMHPPTSRFQKCFDAYNFSVISNFFDSDKLYALSTHNRKCAKKMQHIWRSTRNWGQKLNEICLKITQKAPKKPLQHVNVKNFSGRPCPRTPLESFWFLNQLQIGCAENK